MLKNRGEEGGRSLRRSRTLLCLEGVLPLLDTPFLFIRLCHQRDEKAWRRPFQSPRCTIHGSGEERNGAFMNFTSPARRKLHKNS